MFLGRVNETFPLPGRGLIVILDASHAHVTKELDFWDSEIEVRGDGKVFRTLVGEQPMIDPPNSDRPFVMLLPSLSCEEDIPAQAEIWSIESDALDSESLSNA
jgi:hypothetical protein